MKKLTKILLSVLAVVILSISLVGCNFVLNDELDGGDGQNPGNVNFSQTLAQPISYIENESGSLIDSGEYAVTFGAYSAENRKSFNGDYKAAYQAVSRACVAIMLSTEGSSYYTYGSGTIVEVEGATQNNEYYILTANHVIEDLGKITVYVPDENGRNYTEAGYDFNKYAFTGVLGDIETDMGSMPNDEGVNRNGKITLVGGDKQSDVGVIKLTLTEAEAARLDICQVKIVDSNYKVNAGDSIFAIGNPTGLLPGTLSVGYVAYPHRTTTVSNIGEMNLIQLNLNIWHGSSGGALFNEYGELIGITNAGDDDNPGINFAVSHQISENPNVLDNGFIDVAKQLIATKNKYPRNYGFVSGHAQKFGLTTQNNSSGNVVVIGVESGSIAEKAGLKVNDIIMAVNGETVFGKNASAECREKILSVKIGGSILLDIKRGNKLGYLTLPVYQYRLGDTGLDLPIIPE